MITRTIKRIWNFLLSGLKGRCMQEKMLQGFAALDKIEKKGILTWMRKGRYLLLEEPFAISILATGKKGAKNIFTMIALWQNFHIFLEAAEQIRLETELAAVRKAQTEHPSLTKEDIRRIRLNARNNMPELDPDKIDYVREFDLFVIRSSAPSAQDATEENGQLVALGHFDGKELQMAMYEDVKYNLMRGKDENH
nr:MAG TPA: hypothetical protein [Caudoviricetes sp.]